MKKLALLALCFLLVACAAIEPTAPRSSGLTFVHLNDTYRVGAVEDGTAGGFGRVVTVIRELQAAGKDVRILHGGDFLYPSLESQLWNGQQMVEAFNFMDALAPMYVVAGNHEFDRRTPEHLVNAVAVSTFDWLGDNYQFVTGNPDADAALLSAFTIEHEGKTIGIFSLTTHAQHGGNDRSYVPIDIDYLGNAERLIEHFESTGVDAIIGLTHLRVAQDLDIARLRAKHPTFVFIVGGHDHEPEFSPLGDGSAAVMKGASNARVIWSIDLAFDAAGLPVIEPKRLSLDTTVPVDPEYQLLDDKWRGLLLERFPFLEARVGTAALQMDAREVAVRSVESSWGNFITDQMRTAFGKPTADLAFINGGTLRIDDMIEDDIRFEDIGRTFGFSSFLRHTTVSGAEFRQVMEAGYRGEGGTQGYFPQISGFRLCVDRSRKELDRIVSLQVPTDGDWREIEADKEYSLVVPDFLYGGGDGYQIPKDRPASRPASELKYLVLDAVLAAQAQGLEVGVVVDAQNRRFHELREGKEPCFVD
jgi:2',3'-cyclic-nucleotide 2'-phosphodiesterase (5'-nucleotidase family)